MPGIMRSVTTRFGRSRSDQLEPLEPVRRGQHLELAPQRHVDELDDVGAGPRRPRPCRGGPPRRCRARRRAARWPPRCRAAGTRRGAASWTAQSRPGSPVAAPPRVPRRRERLGAEVAAPRRERDGEAGPRVAVAARAGWCRRGASPARAPARARCPCRRAAGGRPCPPGRSARRSARPAPAGSPGRRPATTTSTSSAVRDSVDRDVSARRGELDGVGEQVHEDPLQPLRGRTRAARGSQARREGEGDLLAAGPAPAVCSTSAAQLADQVVLASRRGAAGSPRGGRGRAGR